MIDKLTEVLLSAFVGAIVAGLGYFINYFLQRKQALEFSHRDAEIKMLEQQIEELYGPLWGLLEQSKAVYDVVCKILPSIEGGTRKSFVELNQQEAEIFNFFKDTYFVPTNAQIAHILTSKIDLVEQQQIPESFHEFITYYAHFECLHRLWKDKQVETKELIKGVRWPTQFNVDVKNTLDALRQRRLELSKYQHKLSMKNPTRSNKNPEYKIQSCIA